MKANNQVSTNPRADPCRDERGRALGPSLRCLSPKSLEDERFPRLTAAIFLSALAELIPCTASNCKTLKNYYFLCLWWPLLFCAVSLSNKGFAHTSSLPWRSVIKRSLSSAQPAVLIKCRNLMPLMSSALLSNRGGIGQEVRELSKNSAIAFVSFP